MASDGAWSLVKQAYNDWSEDKASRLAAALAYYTMLSIAPLLIISIKVVGAVFGEEAARGQIQGYMHETMGTKGAQAAQDMIANASQSGGGLTATIISSLVLVLSASGVFGALQDSLNTIWEVEPRPDRGLWGTIRDRFFSALLVFGVAFLLMVSLIISTAVSAVMGGGGGGGEGWLFSILHLAVSVGVLTMLFALMFKFVPDARVPWRDVWLGAAVTAVLFTIGKYLLGWYLGRSATTSIYGAAGALVAMLIWVYYSAQILFFGAELTQAMVRRRGHGIEPTAHARLVTERERAQQGMGAGHAAAPLRPQPAPAGGGPAARIVQISRPLPEAQRGRLVAASGLAVGLAIGAAGIFGRWLLTPRFSDTAVGRRLTDVERRMAVQRGLRRLQTESDLDRRLAAVGDRLSDLSHRIGGLPRRGFDAAAVRQRLERIEQRHAFERGMQRYGRRLAAAHRMDDLERTLRRIAQRDAVAREGWVGRVKAAVGLV